jgi:putative DNA primase/helicase
MKNLSFTPNKIHYTVSNPNFRAANAGMYSTGTRCVSKQSTPSMPAYQGISLSGSTWHTPLPSAPSTQALAATMMTAISPGKGRKKKGGERTAEMTYADYLSKNGKFAVRDKVLHQWNGSCFELIDDDRCISHALKWLDAFFPERANPQAAASCVKTASLMVPEMPKRNTSRTIIPIKNAYLEVLPSGIIVRHIPDQSFGMTFTLNISLSGTGATYAPSPMPATSLLATYLASSVPDADVCAYLQELMGDTLSPSTGLQVATLLKGGGRNGKSVLVKLMSSLHERAAAMRLNQLSGFNLMPLLGASLVVVDEVPKVGFDEQMLKCLISGEQVSIDRKYLTQVSYRPTAKWIICTNNDQKSRDNSSGFWRRLVVVPFTHQVPEDQVIVGLDRKIIDQEMQLLLDWCLLGLQRLIVRGKLPAAPAAIHDAKHQAVLASDTVAAWIEHEGVQVSTENGHRKDKDDVFERYVSWCSRNRYHPLSSVNFWSGLRALLELGADQQLRVHGQRKRFVGLKFHDDDVDQAEVSPFDGV